MNRKNQLLSAVLIFFLVFALVNVGFVSSPHAKANTGSEGTGNEKDNCHTTGEWSVSQAEGTNVYTYKSGNDTCSFEQKMRDNFTYSADVRILHESSAGTSLMFRVKNDQNYYFFRIQDAHDRAQLFKVVDGEETKIGEAAVRIDVDEWQTMKVEVKDNLIRGYVDNLLVLEEHDATFKKGKVGLLTHGTPAEYKNIAIQDNVRQLPLSKEERLSQWFNDAKIGWFPHWGMGTGHPSERKDDGYVYFSAEEFEQAATDGGWSAEKWVRHAKSLHAKYISIATFHSRLGYIKIWPSEVPGSMHTGRDFLGELIKAADKEGIKVLVYITGDPLWWNNNRDDQQAPPPSWLPAYGFLNNDAYREYKNNPDIDIHKNPDFKRYYAKDVINELATNYPKIAGFWFDGWAGNAKENLEVFDFVHAKMPDAVVIKNNSGTSPVPNEDVMAQEDHNRVYSPSYDLASGSFVGPYQSEFAFTAITGWWYRDSNGNDVLDKEQYLKPVKQIITTIGSSWNANLGIGPKVDGDLPTSVAGFVDHWSDFLSWAEESIFDTVGGGYDKGGFQPGNWNDGAYGVTTVAPGKNTHYIHVLEAPAVKYQNLQKWDGSKFTFTDMEDKDRAVIDLEVDKDGNTWVVNSDYDIWKYNGELWSKVAGKAQNIAAGSDGSIWMIGPPKNTPAGDIYKWDGEKFVRARYGGIRGTVSNDGVFWFVSNGDNLYSYSEQTGLNSYSDALDIASAVDGSIWRISMAGELEKWNGSDWDSHGGENLTRLALDTHGSVWAVNDSNQIVKYDGGKFVSVAGKAGSIKTGLDGSVWKLESETEAELNEIHLPDGGYDVLKAYDLKTGQELSFSQQNGAMKIAVPNWETLKDAGDQIIKITTTSKPRVLPDKWMEKMTVSATAEDPDYPASNMIDGQYETIFSAGEVTLPESVRLDLARKYKNISGFKVTQPETSSVTSGPKSSSNRIKDFKLYVSMDGEDWSLVKEGSLLNQRGSQVINFDPVDTRYIKLDVLNTQNGENNVLKIADLQIITSEETPTDTSAASMSALVEQFEGEGEFANHGAAHSLQVHLTAVSRYEEKGLAEKVVKHMKSFKLLLDHQTENEFISDKAYNILKDEADALIQKWQ